MTESHQTSPIIPVIDERLGYQAGAPADHKVKVDKYNDMLEDIYQREVELAKMKSALIDMGSEIAEEVGILNGSVKDETSADDEEKEEQLESDSGKKEKKHYKSKPKGKGQYNRRSKMVDSELDAEWDYKLELMSMKRERRASDASVEMVPLRAAKAIASH